MPQNITKQIVIGYYDLDGYPYCLKHGRPGMDEISNEDHTFVEYCSVCGGEIDTKQIN